MTFAIDSSRALFKPTYKTEDAIGFDICTNESLVIKPGCTRLAYTGLYVDLVNTDGEHELQIRSRSGLAFLANVVVLNSPGTIDPSFPGEILVILHNVGDDIYYAEPGTRIAQGVVVKREPRALGVEVEDSVRVGGFGHTGV